MSTHLIAVPLSSAAANHGAILASWSRRVTITSSPGPRVRAIERQRQVQRRHVWPEDDLVRRTTEEIGARSAGLGDHRVGGGAGGEGTTGVGVAALEVGGHGVDHLGRYLGASRRVDEDITSARSQRRKALAKVLHIELHILKRNVGGPPGLVACSIGCRSQN